MAESLYQHLAAGRQRELWAEAQRARLRADAKRQRRRTVSRRAARRAARRARR